MGDFRNYSCRFAISQFYITIYCVYYKHYHNIMLKLCASTGQYDGRMQFSATAVMTSNAHTRGARSHSHNERNSTTPRHRAVAASTRDTHRKRGAAGWSPGERLAYYVEIFTSHAHRGFPARSAHGTRLGKRRVSHEIVWCDIFFPTARHVGRDARRDEGTSCAPGTLTSSSLLKSGWLRSRSRLTGEAFLGRAAVTTSSY